MDDIQDLRNQWVGLLSQGKFHEAEKLYWDKLFSKVQDTFLDRNNFSEECDWLILPSGLEASYYILLIKVVKPKKVYFLGTNEFKETFINRIIELSGLKPSQYIIDIIDYKEMDVSDVYDKIRSKLELFLGKKVLIDLTRGKRILSVGAGIVGSFFGFDLVYIDEDWVDDIKRGLPGTEKLVFVKNPFDVFGDLELKEARHFFDHYNYGAALSLYKRIKQKIIDPRYVEIEELLAEAYMHWNSFNFKAALSKMELALSKSRQYNLRSPPNIKDNISALKIMAESSDLQIKDSDNFNVHIIVDLYTNALRKAETGVFEDAISRLYRVLELISQYRLKNYAIDTASPQIKKYESSYKAATKELYGFEKELPLEIGLKDGYILLFTLQDFVLDGYSLDDLKRMFGVIRARDMSIIAHGLQLAGEKVFVNMNNLAKSFIKNVCDKQGINFSNVLNQHSFVKL
jgi:CRISPR-associated protein (TIGR02710 family)